MFKNHIAGLPLVRPEIREDMIRLGANESPRSPSPRVVAAVQAAVSSVNRYPDSGCNRLREVLAARNQLTPNNILVGNGSEELITSLALGFLNPGDEAIMANATFPLYRLVTTKVGGHAVQVPLRPDFTLDLPAMADALGERTRLVFVCNPNNPTGTTVTTSELDTFLQRVPAEVVVALDEAYHDFVDQDDYPRAVSYVRAGRRNVVIVRTFSKVYGLAGLRVGYALGHEETIAYLARCRGVFTVNALAQVAALVALEDTEYVERALAANAASRRFIFNELAALGIPYIPTCTNFIAVDVGRPADEVARLLAEKGILTTPLDSWGVPNHLRISLGLLDENERVIQALAAVL